MKRIKLNFQEKVKIWLKRDGHTIEWLSDKLSVSRQTLHARFRTDIWHQSEIDTIKKLMNEFRNN